MGSNWTRAARYSQQADHRGSSFTSTFFYNVLKSIPLEIVRGTFMCLELCASMCMYTYAHLYMNTHAHQHTKILWLITSLSCHKALNNVQMLFTQCSCCCPDTRRNHFMYRKGFSKVFSLSQSSRHITKSKKNWMKNVFGPSLCLVHLWLDIEKKTKNYQWYLEKCQDWHGDERLGQRDLWQYWKCDPECPETATLQISRSSPVGEATINNWLPLQWLVVGVELWLQVYRYEPQRCRKRGSIRKAAAKTNGKQLWLLLSICVLSVTCIGTFCMCLFSCHINGNQRNTTNPYLQCYSSWKCFEIDATTQANLIRLVFISYDDYYMYLYIIYWVEPFLTYVRKVSLCCWRQIVIHVDWLLLHLASTSMSAVETSWWNQEEGSGASNLEAGPLLSCYTFITVG